MTYILLLVLGIVSAYIINLATDYEKCGDADRLKWFFGYVCGKPQYIVVMVLTPLAFMLLYCKSRTNLEMIRYAVLYILLASSSLKDYKERIVSNKLVAAGIVLGLVMAALDAEPEKFIQSVILFIAIALIMSLISFATKGGVGMGDTKLIAVSGLYTGLTGIISVLFYSFILSGITGIVLLILKKANSKSRIPFIPFLTLGFLIYLLLL
ncbi:MAG TPA: prepilin peptidase [Hungateiclostridium thermocellum]|jgi:leader peptidase (prepilin peptidase)/N-methyltransferase|uniref:Peptidase A24A prepilin type IV n=2 Tax=Acetivibrio thermocellus TaxID=1515 RepID=A3DF38_ACET2|nr:prepilin peptidase [Acetivibrio thermocellus]CDG36009.1 peptidase A24A, prepilin type IV [Acetivibrio thermocellus BC1]ABN52567.1 peptidase A24A prepilin type IV [Acetivibrio thermocellus ATCC 27405]ADU73987.1 peptidase A24A prepilin type IV [Acetivibrio thermocellus DSM 1313]ALX07925.1 peptidase A24A prepilin type IV [Acetivibrio thermocellus AD2]ANV75671.1 peptidase A24A prepilin type IV [Acetivibrio thermocellus DSM 2360]